MKVLKFGGTSVGTVDSLKNVKKIVESLEVPSIIVVSALGGLTDKLILTAREAATGSDSHRSAMDAISARHRDIINTVIDADRRGSVMTEVDRLLKELSDVYLGISLIKSLPERVLDIVVSYGERMSSVIVAGMIENSRHYDSLGFIRTERWFNKDIADGKLTGELISAEFELPLQSHAVLGGFISRDRDTGEITNLGRGGSDYTAALIAGTLGADVLEIWTDVDGFMTSDPRIIKNAKVIGTMTFIESMELCNFGAKVIYPPTIYPVFHKNIPIRILNTFNPEAPGTYISDSCDANGRVIGVSSMPSVSLITVTGNSSDGGAINTRAYNAMARNGMSVLLSGNADSEQSFSLVVRDNDADNAKSLLESEFAPEMQSGEVAGIAAEKGLSIIAAVGESIKKINGLAARLNNTLQRNGIAVKAMSEGSSETTIAVVVDTEQKNEALRLVHDSAVTAVVG